MSQEYNDLISAELDGTIKQIMEFLKTIDRLDSVGVASMLALSASILGADKPLPNAEDHRCANLCIEMLTRKPGGTQSILSQIAKGVMMVHLGFYKKVKGK